MPAFELRPYMKCPRKLWQITGKPWISSAAYKAISGNAYHDGYQIEEICLNAYHGKYETSGILPESVSLYTLNRQFNSSITQCTHTSRIGASSMALYHRTTVKTRKSCDSDGKHRKNVHFYCFRVYPNPICRRRAEENAALTTLSPPLKWTLGNIAEIPTISKEGLLSKPNTICTLK